MGEMTAFVRELNQGINTVNLQLLENLGEVYGVTTCGSSLI